jgi:hypothetical protein
VVGTQIPETDLHRAQQFCSRYWPERFHDQVRCEYHVRGNTLTLCETRAPWDGSGEWTHEPIAQLRFRPETADWSLHWPDRNTRWHEYHEGNVFAGTMQRLLREVDDDPTGIFKG